MTGTKMKSDIEIEVRGTTPYGVLVGVPRCYLVEGGVWKTVELEWGEECSECGAAEKNLGFGIPFGTFGPYGCIKVLRSDNDEGYSVGEWLVKLNFEGDDFYDLIICKRLPDLLAVMKQLTPFL